MRRDLPLLLSVALALALLAGFAWLTWYPEQPWLRAAAERPVVGPLARAFLARWAPQPPARDASLPTASEGSRRPPMPPATAGAPAPVGALPQRWIPAGTVLRHAPAEDAAVVAVVPAVINAFVVEERGAWWRLRAGTAEGWAPALPAGDGPPLGWATEPVLPLPDLPPDRERLAQARRLLGDAEREATVGPYRLVTDTPDVGTLVLLDRAVTGLEEVYAARFGVAPIGEPAAVVVLFQREEDYRSFAGAEGSSGHSWRGIVSLARENRPPEQVRATLVHEVVHLLNRRALGPALPSWLDEGLADHLAEAAVGADGRPVPGTLSEVRLTDAAGGWTSYGGKASRQQLRRALARDAAPAPSVLVGLDRDEFLVPEGRALRYTAAGAFVGWLAETRHQALRDYLRGIAAGGPADAEELRRRLGASWPELDRAWRDWVTAASPAVSR